MSRLAVPSSSADRQTDKTKHSDIIVVTCNSRLLSYSDISSAFDEPLEIHYFISNSQNRQFQSNNKLLPVFELSLGTGDGMRDRVMVLKQEYAELINEGINR